MPRRLLLLFALVLTLPARAADPLPVVPYPQEVTFAAGFFPIDPAATAIRVAGDTTGMMLGVQELTAAFEAITRAAPGLNETAAQTIWLGLPAEDRAFRERCRTLRLWPDDRLGDEGYALHIAPDEIVLAAATRTGLFYGVQTLKQLLRGFRTEGRLPALRIADWPALRYRGLMDDISRGPVPTLATMKAQVRRLAELKLNLLTYYTEHVVATEQHGTFAPSDGGLSIAEWRELAAYARRYHVTLVGNFQSFGHFEKVLAHPRYAPLGESGRLLSPVLPESIQLLREIYEEMVPAFGAPFFHVNSDETFDLGRGASKARVDSLGRGVVYAEHILRMHHVLDSLGVRMLLWGDIVREHPEVLDRLPRDIVMIPWAYSPQETFVPMIAPFQEAGFDVLVAPGVLNSNRIMPDFREAVANIQGFVADGVRRGVLGMLNTVWDDGGSALFVRDWYGVAYGADQSWHSNAQPFDPRFSRGTLGDPQNSLPDAIHALNTLADLTPTDGMNENVLWTQLVPARGASLRLSLGDWDGVRLLADSARAVLAQAEPLVYAGDLDAFRFTADLYTWMADARQALVDAAEAYRSASLQQRTDRTEARERLVESLELVDRTRQTLAVLAGTYRTLWLRENRTYALDWTMDRFDTHLTAFADVEDRLLTALRDVDQGLALPLPTEVRLAIEAAEGTYFREWLMGGPLPHPGGSDAPPGDYLAAMGGEADARPGVAVEWTYDGTTYRWHRYASPLHDAVDLAAAYPEQNRKLAIYAYATLDSPEARRVRALAGANDGLDVFLNGEHIFSKHRKRNLMVDEDELWLPLQKGRNHLLLKISQGAGGWGFSFRLPDETVRSRKNRYRIVEDG